MNLSEYFNGHHRLFLMGTVDGDMLDSFTRQEAEYLERPHAERLPLAIMVSSPGGDNGPARVLHERIRMLAAVMPVSIIAIGDCASAGVTIFLAVKKEARFTTRDTEFMIHQTWHEGLKISSAPMSGRRQQMEEETFNQLGRELYLDWVTGLIARQCGQRKREVAKWLVPGKFFTAKQAIEFGLASKILV